MRLTKEQKHDLADRVLSFLRQNGQELQTMGQLVKGLAVESKVLRRVLEFLKKTNTITASGLRKSTRYGLPQ